MAESDDQITRLRELIQETPCAGPERRKYLAELAELLCANPQAICAL